jgi:hypothetical protein
MKYKTAALMVFLMLVPLSGFAEDFLGAPVISDAAPVTKTESRYEFKTGLSHDKALAFYRKALEELDDIKFREWKDATYIEDDGRLPWHSITISKGEREGTTVVIVKDNWTWIIGTLLLRYIGVFVVLMVLFLGMALSGRIISGVMKKREKEA